MSDLQCPATILLIADESLRSSRPGLAKSGHLAAVFIASAVAADLDPLAAATRLAGVADGATLAQAMEDLADLHRGETIAIVAPREMIQHALGTSEPPADLVAVDIDASGWSVRPE